MLALLSLVAIGVVATAQDITTNKTEVTGPMIIENVNATSDWNPNFEYGERFCVNDPEHAFFFDWNEVWWAVGPGGASSGGANHGIGIQFGKTWIEEECLKHGKFQHWWEYKTIHDIAHNNFCGCNHDICLDCQYSSFNDLKDGDWLGRMTSPIAMGCHRSIGGRGVFFNHGAAAPAHTHQGMFSASVGIECRTNW